MSAGLDMVRACNYTPMLLLQPLRYLPVDKRGISTSVKSIEVYGGVAHGYLALMIGAVDISSTTVAGQVSDTNRFVHDLHDLLDLLDHHHDLDGHCPVVVVDLYHSYHPGEVMQ
jgi:hypothetical protein